MERRNNYKCAKNILFSMNGCNEPTTGNHGLKQVYAQPYIWYIPHALGWLQINFVCFSFCLFLQNSKPKIPSLLPKLSGFIFESGNTRIFLNLFIYLFILPFLVVQKASSLSSRLKGGEGGENGQRLVEFN